MSVPSVRSVRIGLIHAVRPAMAPVEAAFIALWPEAERMNLLDDSLAPDRDRAGALTPAFFPRMRSLADYAVAQGAQGILYTCSAFGAAIDAVAKALPIPVLTPNEAMFTDAIRGGRRVGMLATFQPSVAGMEAEFRAVAPAGTTIETVCIVEARQALDRGDVARHDDLLAAAAPRLAHCDCVMLAHFSTATAHAKVQAALDRRVLTAPGAAVTRLRSLLGAGQAPR